MRKALLILGLFVFGGCSFFTKAAKEAQKYVPEEVFLIKLALHPGERFNYNVQTVTTNTMDFQGQSQSSDIRTDMDVAITVKKVEGDDLDIVLTIEKASGTVSSSQGMSSIPGLDKIAGKSIEMRLNNNGEILKIDKLEGVQGISDIARQFAEMFLFIPGRTVKVGQTWTKHKDLDGSSGDYTFLLKDVKLAGGKKIGIIDEKGVINIDKTQNMMGMNADVHLKGKEKSTISVSVKNGLPVERKVESGFEGTSTFSGGNLPGSMEMKMYVDNTITIKMK